MLLHIKVLCATNGQNCFRGLQLWHLLPLITLNPESGSAQGISASPICWKGSPSEFLLILVLPIAYKGLPAWLSLMGPQTKPCLCAKTPHRTLLCVVRLYPTPVTLSRVTTHEGTKHQNTTSVAACAYAEKFVSQGL